MGCASASGSFFTMNLSSFFALTTPTILSISSS